VALLGGTIAIESSPGKGSTIFAQIPLGASEAAA
jgi:signal transduction histidine kinase